MDNCDIIYYICKFLTTFDVIHLGGVNQKFNYITRYIIDKRASKIYKLYCGLKLRIPPEKQRLIFNLGLLENDINLMHKYKPNNPFEGLNTAAFLNSKLGIYYFIPKCNYNWNMCLFGAAMGGHKELVDYLISRGADNWEEGLSGAARGNHKKLIDFFILKGATNFDSGLQMASYRGDKDLVDFFISKGATFLSAGMKAAAYNNDKELVDYFISKGANWFELAIEDAEICHHIELANHIKAEKVKYLEKIKYQRNLNCNIL